MSDAPVDRQLAAAPLLAALDLIDQGYTLIDGDLHLVAWNRAFITLLDFPPALARVGTPFADFIRYNAERGEYGPGAVEEQVATRVADARRFEAHEFERVRPDGRVLKVRGVPVPGIGFITLYSDVTAQRRAEQQVLEYTAEIERRVAERTTELQLSEAQMRLITDSLPALIAYFDAGKAYRYINRGYRDWFGVDPQRPQDCSARQYLGDATYESIRPNVARAFAGEPVSYEYEARCVDGRTRTARTTLIPEKGPDGAVIGCFELTFDVSELRRAEQQLAQADKMEALGQLTGGLAHDFNNMLTVIVGNLGALRERCSPHDTTEYLDPALSAARRGAELIRALLGFARRQPLHTEAIAVAPLTALVVKLLRRSLPDGVSLEATESPGEPAVDAQGSTLHAWVDGSQLQDALVNLILNARDAGATRIVVRASAATLSDAHAMALQALPGHCVRIDVVDDGHGMDAATQARIFEPFFTTKRAGSGTGLGMSMVYGFVRQSQGGIAIDSTPGRGSCVSIWLPAADELESDRPGTDGAPAARLAEPVLALLVEDDPEVRRVVRRALVDLGYAVLEAEHGAEALEILAHTPGIGLLLSDVVMPGGVDGREVARRARAHGVPRVALMSGYVPDDLPTPDDGVRLLAKPFSREQLAAFLADTVDA